MWDECRSTPFEPPHTQDATELLDAVEVQLLPYVRRVRAARPGDSQTILDSALQALLAAGCEHSSTELGELKRRLAALSHEKAA